MANSAEDTHTEVGHEAGHSNFPPFDASTFPSQLLWFALIFGAMYYYLSKRYLPAVGGVIEARRARIAKDIDDATALQRQADEAAAEHEKALAKARADAQATAQAAREKVAADSDARRKTLEDQLAAKLAEAEARIAGNRQAAMANVSTIARDAAGAIVERLIGRAPDAAAVASAVEFDGARLTGGKQMDFNAEFYVLCGFVVFVLLLIGLGAHKTVLNGLDARGKAIADELAQAAKLRAEAQALLASFDKKRAEAEAQAAAIVADAHAQANEIAKDAAVRMEEFVTRRTAQAEAKIAFAEAQATAEVRAAAADHAARAAEVVLRGQAQGPTGAELVSREIGALKARLN